MRLRHFVFATLVIANGLAWAELPVEAVCVRGLLGTNPKSVNPNGAKVTNSTIGRVSIDFFSDGHIAARFNSEVDVNSRKNGGSGEELIQTLSNHADPSSPTALRVEEKAVVPQARLNQFLSETQSQAFAARSKLSQPLRWQLRDNPPAGKRFVTITEYGKHFVFNLPKSNSAFVVKPRFRKYFEAPAAPSVDPSEHRSVMGNLTALELKITVANGPGTDAFLSHEDTVFKPRIMISDEIADRIKALDGRDPDLNSALFALKNETLGLPSSAGRPLNNPAHVESMFQALGLLLAKDAKFLQPSFAVQYERSSYRAMVDRNEFQFTADRNVRIYSAAQISSSRMQNYLGETPLFQSGPDETFAELKSPVSEKQNGSAIYTSLRSGLDREHVPVYRKGSGKFAIARMIDQEIRDQYVDRTLIDQGTKYWLIKGTGNLDSAPKKNDLLAKGDIEVAFPVTTRAGQRLRVQFRYKQVNRMNEGRQGVLDRIRIYNDMGFEIPVKPGFDDLLWQASRREADEVLSLEVDGTILPFKSRITSQETAAYKKFFLDFYEYQTHLRGQPRSLETLDRVGSAAALERLGRSLKLENVVHFIIDRTKRVALGAVITVAALSTYQHVMTPKIVNTPTQQEISINRPDASVDRFPEAKQPSQPVVLRGLRSPKYGILDLHAVPDTQGGFVFVVPEQTQTRLRIERAEKVEFFAGTGDRIVFSVFEGQTGQLLLRPKAIDNRDEI